MCLCTSCRFGELCQYSMELMSYTLDSLMIKDITNENTKTKAIIVFISSSVLLFFFGTLTNSLSIITFKRHKPRENIVGSYLLQNSIINQCSLFFLLMKIVHIILSSTNLLRNDLFNLILCKTISYSLSVSTRMNYWFSSWVTLTRLGLALFPTARFWKNNLFGHFISILTVLIVLGMHVHELIFYVIIDNPQSTSVQLCVTNYSSQVWFNYNKISVLVHYLVPCALQLLSITLLILTLVRSRLRSTGNQSYRNVILWQIKANKEAYITPLILLISALPQAILAFNLACSEINQNWQRYSLLSAYFFSYSPQILGFILFVLPSTLYRTEFYQTPFAKRLCKPSI